MAWPVNAFYESLVAGVTTVKKTLGDAIQQSIINLYGGTKTLVSLDVDGVGDQAATAAAGTVLASGTIRSAAGDLIATAGNIAASLGYVGATTSYLFSGGTLSSGTAGAGQGLTIGRAYKDSLCAAWAVVDNNGAAASLTRGVNISSVARNGQGDVSVTLVNGVANQICAVANGFDNAEVTCTINVTSTSTTVVRVITRSGGATVDAKFMLAVYGG